MKFNTRNKDNVLTPEDLINMILKNIPFDEGSTNKLITYLSELIELKKQYECLELEYQEKCDECATLEAEISEVENKYLVTMSQTRELHTIIYNNQISVLNYLKQFYDNNKKGD